MNKTDKLESFKGQKVTFIEAQQIKAGVECDVYSFMGDGSKDLGLIRIQKGAQTPKQLILKGEKTVEGLLQGDAILETSRGTFNFHDGDTDGIELKVNDSMQWTALEDSILYEICYPPYEDGRFKDLR